jgi:hypothetical protein
MQISFNVPRTLLRMAAISLITFFGTLLLTAAAIYMLLGHDGVIGGGGLVLILVPLAAAASVTGAVIKLIFKPVTNDFAPGDMLSRLMKNSSMQIKYKMLIQQGTYICLNCGHIDSGRKFKACSKCGKPFTLDEIEPTNLDTAVQHGGADPIIVDIPPPAQATELDESAEDAMSAPAAASGSSGPTWREVEPARGA